MIRENITYPNGDQYYGYVKNCKRNGYGVMTYTDGTIYEGEWKDNNYDGQGYIIYNNDGADRVAGSRSAPLGQSGYHGIWKDNKYNGYGTRLFYNGYTYSGHWTNGLLLLNKKYNIEIA